MLISDVCRQTGLTRKAVEYYIEQELLCPPAQENGYRTFDAADVERLKRIAVLRALNVSAAQIREILSDSTPEALCRATHAAELSVQDAKNRQALLESLARGATYTEIADELQALDQRQTILQKLLLAFPGYYGRAVSLHFAAFLNEPIATEEQRAAYETIVEYLDSTQGFALPDDLSAYLEEATRGIGTQAMADMTAELHRAANDTETYIAEHRELLEQYIAYRQSEEYRNSPAYRLQEQLRAALQLGGYNDVFLPAMERLSESYRVYRKALHTANETLLARYPEIREWYP